MREMLALLLDGEGHRTTTVADGRKALELAGQGAIRPDLIVADYNLPKGLNGLQVVAGLRETLGREVPAVILTGDISTGTLREIAQGGHLHLNKPVKARELTDLIRRCLAGSPPPLRAGTRQPAEAAGDRRRRLRPTIFVVDDDSAVREAMRDLLRANGWTVETYASSEAFLDAYRPGGEGCLLLVDARMPGMGGLELLQQLKSDGRSAAGYHDHRPRRRADGGRGDAGRGCGFHRKADPPRRTARQHRACAGARPGCGQDCRLARRLRRNVSPV